MCNTLYTHITGPDFFAPPRPKKFVCIAMFSLTLCTADGGRNAAAAAAAAEAAAAGAGVASRRHVCLVSG